MKRYEEKIVVRGYELDSLGHVNHAQYLLYAESVRWNHFIQLGFTHQKMFKEMGVGPVILNLNITYLKELNFGDEITITNEVVKVEGKKMSLHQEFLVKGEKAAELDLLFVFIDLAKRRSTEIPAEMMKALQ